MATCYLKNGKYYSGSNGDTSVPVARLVDKLGNHIRLVILPVKDPSKVDAVLDSGRIYTKATMYELFQHDIVFRECVSSIVDAVVDTVVQVDS